MPFQRLLPSSAKQQLVLNRAVTSWELPLQTGEQEWAVSRLYRHVRGRCEPGSDEKWVCPGVGAAGALTAGGIAAYVLAGRGDTPRVGQGCPALAEASATIGLPKFSIGH